MTMSDTWNTLRTQIEFFTTPFPDEAIAYADAHREEVTPFLVESIVRLAEHPAEGDNPDYVLHLYAMHLLAVWRETATYLPLARLGHHSYDVVDRLLGDTVTESYGRCLASVCDGNLLALQELVEDSGASHWARNAALEAYMVRVFEGDASRDELIAYLIRLGDTEAARLRAIDGDFDDLQILDSVVSVATDIGATELMERIRSWFDDELVNPMLADLPWIESHISRPYEVCRDEQLQRGNRYVTSVREEIGWWAGFRENETPPPRSMPVAPPVLPVRSWPKIGRNDPCPCGSGKKHKKCCGA
jgi:hypothetical protein